MMEKNAWVEQAPVGLLAIHGDSTITQINTMLLKLLNYERDELIVSRLICCLPAQGNYSS